MPEDRAVIRALGAPGDLGWVLMAHGELYAAEYDWAVEAVTARVVADYAATARPGRDHAWIAEHDGRRVGSVFCVRVDDATAKLRLLLVDPAVRGQRLGTRLVTRCVDFARDSGYQRVVLWTNEPLTAARRLYLEAGFRLVAEDDHHDFGPELRGQEYELELSPAPQPV